VIGFHRFPSPKNSVVEKGYAIMNALLHDLIEATPRHDRQIMIAAVIGSILLVLITIAAGSIAA
jgi:hypothetical protein